MEKNFIFIILSFFLPMVTSMCRGIPCEKCFETNCVAGKTKKHEFLCLEKNEIHKFRISRTLKGKGECSLQNKYLPSTLPSPPSTPSFSRAISPTKLLQDPISYNPLPNSSKKGNTMTDLEEGTKATMDKANSTHVATTISIQKGALEKEGNNKNEEGKKGKAGHLLLPGWAKFNLSDITAAFRQLQCPPTVRQNHEQKIKRAYCRIHLLSNIYSRRGKKNPFYTERNPMEHRQDECLKIMFHFVKCMKNRQ